MIILRRTANVALQTNRRLSFRSASVVSHNAHLPLANSINQSTTQINTANYRMSSSIKRLGVNSNPNMSSAVVHNGILTTMGVIDTNGGDVQAQTQNILDHIDRLLVEGGTDKSKVLTANIWLKDIASDFGKMNEIWLKWIDSENKPARACVEANLAFPSLLVEIQVAAVVD